MAHADRIVVAEPNPVSMGAQGDGAPAIAGTFTPGGSDRGKERT
jgi:hypothetical protein